MSYVSAIRANGKRVLEDLHHLRSIGAGGTYVPTAFGGDGICKGVVRPALSPEDIEARCWLMDKTKEAGLEPKMDRLGSTIATGSSSSPRLLCGSHSDTQPEGGWLDGALGVVYALEAARALAEAGGPSAIDVVNWQDEEGRFGSLVGSSAFTKGASSVDMDSVSLVPVEVAPRITLAEAVEARGLSDLPVFEWNNDMPYFGYFEAHIEQVGCY
jgi:N-carbamoyl-L-amino-acid hydrolase